MLVLAPLFSKFAPSCVLLRLTFYEFCNERRPYDIHELPSGGRIVPQLEAMGVWYLKDIPDNVHLSDKQRKKTVPGTNKKL